MNVIYASNNNYARYMGVSILSLLDNNQNLKDITIYVLSQEIDLENIKHLRMIADKYHRIIKFIDISKFEKRIPFDFKTLGFNSIILARLFLCSYLPTDIMRILYLDCDIIVNGSIKQLETISLGQNMIAAVPDFYMPVDKKSRIGLKKEDTYYNSGVLLINLELWRSMNIEERFIEFYYLKNEQLLYCDQDILNHCCKGRILTLGYTYNLSTNLFYFPWYFVKKIQPAYKIKGAAEHIDILSHPVIIHYMGDERPWIKGNHNKYRKQYEYYWKKSPWKNEPMVQGKRLYMLCYHILNLITLICPWFRIAFSKVIGIYKYKWFSKS